ncbi:MAG: hypothetical protein LH615_13915 [Ferruginibacter sp.]|nr:hypothetical protein [Ferruginibacter sp.]
MKILKGALIVFIGIFVFITLISLLIPSRIVTARAVAIQSDSIKLFNEISDLKKWKNWHPVFMNDTSAIKISSSVNMINDYAEWTTKGKKTSIVFTEVKYPIITFLLKREGENDSQNTISVMAVQEQGNMQAQWVAITKLKWYPWEKFSGIFIEKMAGSGYEIALQSLKSYVESHQ